MELEHKPPEKPFQDALDSRYVYDIATFLIQESNPLIFRTILEFLRGNTVPVSETPWLKLQELRNGLQGSTNQHGNPTLPSKLDKFIYMMGNMYKEDQKTLGDLRGAILEELARRLVSSHCNAGECQNNYGLVDKERDYKSPQIDVIVLSTERQQIEAYSCKANIKRFDNENAHIDKLIALGKHGQQRGFRTHIGAVSFARSEIVRRQLRNLRCEDAIHAYGADNMKELRNNPFI